jgi:hypothetical protein
MSSPRISVNDNDVLLGRGAGTRERKGNRQFLSIVQQYKEVYSLTTTRAEKLAVAREILNRVKGQSPPGRFLEPCEDIRSHELWQEVDFDKAIGKIKQALREPAHKVAGSESTLPGYQGMAFPQPRSDSLGTTISASLGQSSSWAHGLSAGLSSSLCSDPSLQFRLAAHEGVARTLPMVMSSAAPVPGLALASAAILPCPSPLCQNLGSAGSLVGSLFGQPVPNTFSMQQQEEPQHVAREEQHLSCGRQDSKSAEAPSCSPQASQPSKPEKECNVLCVKPSSSSHEKGGKKERNGRRPLKKRSYPRGFDVEEKERVKESNSTTKSTSNVIPTRADSAERIDSEDVEAAQFLLSNMSEHVRKALAVVEQQDEQITEEDRDQAMADMFGALCEINHSKKRSKRPKERSDSLESLLQEMRREIDALPTYEKLALLEAREAASKFEFTDRRLELFLRRESMNAEKAARRFVLYWEERRKLFGPDKYLLPMTLQGALRDDHDCLKNGPLFAAPAVDASGRILGGYILKRQFGENYDSQSVVCKLGYLIWVRPQLLWISSLILFFFLLLPLASSLLVLFRSKRKASERGRWSREIHEHRRCVNLGL